MQAASALASTASSASASASAALHLRQVHQAEAEAAASMYPAMENLRQALYNFHRGTAAAAAGGNGNVVLAGASSSSSSSTASAPPSSGTISLETFAFDLISFKNIGQIMLVFICFIHGFLSHYQVAYALPAFINS